MGDNITTDHIVPGGAKALSNRSNIPFLSDYCLVRCDENFPANAKKYGGGFIIGGENYGQGSSREHAALVPVYLGIRAVIAKSFARIHKLNLINTGILPLEFSNPNDYDHIDFLDDLILVDVKESLKLNKQIKVINKTKNLEFNLICDATDKEREILISGGMIRYVNKNK